MRICDYKLPKLDNEEMSIQEVIQATVDDFNRTIDRLKNHRTNMTYLRHLYGLIVFMHQDDCFCFMETEPDTFIDIMLSSIGLTLKDVLV
ncbi:MAG: hypothetical protein IKN04_18010 [Clostridia bacterium]|nr:hypothetical protein [Clostridia bacterium]